ncbi:MAG: DUF6331 family protein [Gemmataceae bacterium]
MTAPLELPLSPALRSLLSCCENVCLYECCGIDAYRFEPALVRGWVRRFGPNALDDALRELDAVIAAGNDPGRRVTCPVTRLTTWDDERREELVTFFRSLQASLRTA